MKQVPCCGPTNIRRHHTKFGRFVVLYLWCVHHCVWMFIFCTLMVCHGEYNDLSCRGGGSESFWPWWWREKKSLFIQEIQSRSFDSLGQSRVVVVPALTWKTSVRTVSIRVEIRSRGRQESANHYTSMETWLGRYLHKRTLRYVITPLC